MVELYYFPLVENFAEVYSAFFTGPVYALELSEESFRKLNRLSKLRYGGRTAKLNSKVLNDLIGNAYEQEQKKLRKKARVKAKEKVKVKAMEKQ